MSAPHAPNRISRKPLAAPRLRGICNLPPLALTRVSLMLPPWSPDAYPISLRHNPILEPRCRSSGDSHHTIHSELPAGKGIKLALLTYLPLGATWRPPKFLLFV